MNAEIPVVFSCSGDRLLGILHSGSSDANVGVIFVVGGPQYRVGSHRQFVTMARQLSAAGFAVFRFDYRGMGDSDGTQRTFESIDEDIRAAIDAFKSESPSIESVILLGLCDAASAILMYSSYDDSVRGLVLLNPWARTEKGEARAYVRHYYSSRLLQRTLWQKIFSGNFNYIRSIRDLCTKIIKAKSRDESFAGTGPTMRHAFLQRMEDGIVRFGGPILLLVSGRDLTAAEFLDCVKRSASWQRQLARESIKLFKLPSADHTMSNASDLTSAVETTVRWLESEF
jgi:exosortase A-associated hydrolase 1